MSHTSVCVLSYERPHFLKACIETVRDAGAPIELIVHDDGSQDPAILPYLHEMHERGQISTLILQPPGHNEGVGEAIRKCFAIATGDILMKVDQDLCFVAGWEPVVREILADEAVGLTGLFAYHHDPVDVTKTGILGIDAPKGHTYHTHICGSAFALRADVYNEIGTITTHSDAFAEDWCYMKELSKREYFCALPDDDLCINVGFGIGPSTVVTADGSVHKIHHEPLLFG